MRYLALNPDRLDEDPPPQRVWVVVDPSPYYAKTVSRKMIRELNEELDRQLLRDFQMFTMPPKTVV